MNHQGDTCLNVPAWLIQHSKVIIVCTEGYNTKLQSNRVLGDFTEQWAEYDDPETGAMGTAELTMHV